MKTNYTIMKTCCFAKTNCVFDKEWIYSTYVKCLCNTLNQNESYLLNCQDLTLKSTSIGKDLQNSSSSENFECIYILIVCLALFATFSVVCCVFFFHKKQQLHNVTYYDDENPAEEEQQNDDVGGTF